MINYIPTNFNRDMYIRKVEKRKLFKISNGLGFFIFAYFIMMFATQFLVEIIYLPKQLSGGIDMNAFYYQLIFSSVSSAFISGLFFLLLSKNKITITITTDSVKKGILFPFIFIGMAVSMVANTAATLLSNNLSIFGLENTADSNLHTNSLSEIILYIVAVAIVPAFAEEFAFRGIFMGVLRKHGDAFAIIASSIIFGAMHGNVTQIVFAFILGLIFGYVDCKTNSIIPSIIIHFINNFYAVVLDVLGTSGNINDRIFLSVYYFLIALFCLLGIFSFIYLVRNNKNIFKLKDSNSILTLKEKFGCFFSSAGVILLIVIFSLESVLYIGVL